jgi:signal peptidase I
MGELSLSRLLFLAGLALGVVMPVRWWVLEPISIASASMEPTLLTGVSLFQDKVTLRLRPLQRGDIIVFRSPVGEAHDLVKRVIALPGESVELRDKKVFIAGREIDEPYVKHSRGGERLEGDSLGPLVVPAGHLFVLGDNRDESRDSSVWKDPKTGEPVYFLRSDAVLGIVRGMY